MKEKKRGNQRIATMSPAETDGGQPASLQLFCPSMRISLPALLDEPFTQTRNFGFEFGLFGIGFQLQLLQPLPHI
jgi:hypothetical protein